MYPTYSKRMNAEKNILTKANLLEVIFLGGENWFIGYVKKS